LPFEGTDLYVRGVLFPDRQTVRVILAVASGSLALSLTSLLMI
jgi:hypothetical protein